MKVHTTNYNDSFIVVAEDCPATHGEVPPTRGDGKSVANIQYDILKANPYKFSSDEVLFQVYAERNDITESEFGEGREKFFSKGQPCFRASPLTKRYGWGIHYNKDGKIALFGRETEEYEMFSGDQSLKILKAMKSKR